MKTAYIGLGSNLGNSIRVVQDGWAELASVPGIHLGRLSHPYLSEPVGLVSKNWFINAAGELKTSLSPGELLACLHRVENKFGRRRDPADVGYQDRILDFDLLLYGQTVHRDNNLHLPHPSLQDRLFVLLPLCEIAADVRHPVLDKTMGDLLTDLQSGEGNAVVEMTEWRAGKESDE